MNTPYFSLSKQVAVKRYNELKELADTVSYSSKTNQLITPVLEQETDAMFSVHFKNELKHVKDCSRVIFLAQSWTQKDIVELVKKDIRWFVVDNEQDLNVLQAYLETATEKISVLLRIKLQELSLRTEKYYVFGMESKAVNDKIKELHKKRKNIGQLGVHFHRKTQNLSEWNLVEDVSDLLDEDTLEIIDVLNIGGGLPAEYANTNVAVLNGIKKKISELNKFLHEKNISLILEPGRYIAAPAVKLHTTIKGVHDNTVIVDASVYNSDMDALIVPVKLLIEGEQGSGTPYVVKGVTPCSVDLFRYKVYLDNPKVGDELVFKNAGAYNFTTDFCDLEKIGSLSK